MVHIYLKTLATLTLLRSSSIFEAQILFQIFVCLACVSMASYTIQEEREISTPFPSSTRYATGERNTGIIASTSPAIPLATLGRDKPSSFHQEDAADTLQKWNTPRINLWRVMSCCVVYFGNGINDSGKNLSKARLSTMSTASLADMLKQPVPSFHTWSSTTTRDTPSCH